jgi:hypothetical protein
VAWQLVGPCWRDLRLLRLEVDLHRYSVLTAERIMRDKVQEAWSNGFGEVVLRHGSSTAGKPGAVTIRGRLRELIESGELDRYLRFSGKMRVWSAHDGYAVLELLENPRPRFPRTVRPLPPPDYPIGQRREQLPAEALPPGRGWSG